ncbi:MAG: hypothetical protein J7576_18490 [Siphonobacter aquaeclarae]|nr:hypothetical protein [Siphonobacter aquaeclarae]
MITIIVELPYHLLPTLQHHPELKRVTLKKTWPPQIMMEAKESYEEARAAVSALYRMLEATLAEMEITPDAPLDPLQELFWQMEKDLKELAEMTPYPLQEPESRRKSLNPFSRKQQPSNLRRFSLLKRRPEARSRRSSRKRRKTKRQKRRRKRGKSV